MGAVPALYTPNFNDGHVNAINQVGSRIIVGGTFSNESNHGSSGVLHQQYLFAFNASTGALDAGFLPRLDGAVNSVEPGRARTPPTSRARSRRSTGQRTSPSSC